MWTELLTALALVLVIEGLVPAVNPDGWRRSMRRLLDVEPARLRTAGLGAMIAGALLLVLVR